MEDNFEEKLEEIRKKGRVKMKRNKVYSKIGLIFILIFAVLFLGSIFYLFNKLNKTKTGNISKTYYELLKDGCDNESCCLSSVKTMEEGRFTEAKGGNCPDGFKTNMLRCISSYKWCEPETDDLNKVAISGWKTYNNKEFNFEFKYPNNLYLVGGDDPLGEDIGLRQFRNYKDDENTEGKKLLRLLPSLSVHYVYNFKKENLSSFIENQSKEDINYKEVIIKGNNFIKIEIREEGYNIDSYYTEDNNIIVGLIFYNKENGVNNEDRENVLNTFRFVNNNEPGVKNYRAKNFDFEFAYSKNCEVYPGQSTEKNIIEKIYIKCGEENIENMSFERSISYVDQVRKERQACLDWINQFNIKDIDPKENYFIGTTNGIKSMSNFDDCRYDKEDVFENLYFSNDETFFLRTTGEVSSSDTDYYKRMISFFQSTQHVPADWALYKDEDYGFELHYPKEFFIKNTEGQVVISNNYGGHDSPLNTVKISKINDSIIDTINNIKNRDSLTLVIEDRKININGISFNKLTVTAAIGYNDTHYFFTSNGDNFHVIFVEDSTTEPLLDKIFSTFKLIKG